MFFNFAIKRKRTLRHLRNSQKTSENSIFPFEQYFSAKIVFLDEQHFLFNEKLPLEYSHRNHHLLYTCHIKQLSIGYVRSTKILYMSSLVGHSSLLVQNLQQKC